MTLGTKPEGEYTLALALPGNFGLKQETTQTRGTCEAPDPIQARFTA